MCLVYRVARVREQDKALDALAIADRPVTNHHVAKSAHPSARRDRADGQRVLGALQVWPGQNQVLIRTRHDRGEIKKVRFDRVCDQDDRNKDWQKDARYQHRQRPERAA